MIFTTIKLHGLAHKRREILQTVRGLAEKMPLDSGCLSVDIYQDLDNRDILYLREKWHTIKDLDAYKKSNSLAVLMGIQALLVESIEIKHAVKYSAIITAQNKQEVDIKGEIINVQDNSQKHAT